MQKQTKNVATPDASKNVALNGVRIECQRLADKLRVPMGEVVSWAVAFPRPEFER